MSVQWAKLNLLARDNVLDKGCGAMFVLPPDNREGTAMSKNVGRKQRWAKADARTYSSDLGKVVYQQNGWYAVLDYKRLGPPERAGGPPTWTAHSQRLGPFKRPRNAMVALEQEATFLKNRHGQDILFGEQLWAEA
jgi:hypothetical protein